MGFMKATEDLTFYLGNFTSLYNTERLTPSGHLYTFVDPFKGLNLRAVTCLYLKNHNS